MGNQEEESRIRDRGEALAGRVFGANGFPVTTELTLKKIGHHRVSVVGPPRSHPKTVG